MSPAPEFVVWYRFSRCSPEYPGRPGWAWTYRDLSASASSAGINVGTTTPSLSFDIFSNDLLQHSVGILFPTPLVKLIFLVVMCIPWWRPYFYVKTTKIEKKSNDINVLESSVNYLLSLEYTCTKIYIYIYTYVYILYLYIYTYVYILSH